MTVQRLIYNSPKAEQLANRKLDYAEILLLNILAVYAKEKKRIPAEIMQDVVRSRKHTYTSIIEFFMDRGIIAGRSNFIFINKGNEANRCRHYSLNAAVLTEIAAKTTPIYKGVDLDLSPIDGLSDNSIIEDEVTRATFENLGELTLDLNKLGNAIIELDTYLILRKFVSKIKSVKKSKKTGRISHVLLHAGSKALRQFLLINGKKPLDFDMVSAHWQFVAEYLAPVDASKVHKWLTRGLYETVMEGTGLKDRTTVKKKIQQILTDKPIGRIAAKIKNFVFSELPSLQGYCESVWREGGTVQAHLQRMESNLINSICAKLALKNKWFVPFYDGIWIEADSLNILKGMMEGYIFEQKI